jgi:DNA adenine methylase
MITYNVVKDYVEELITELKKLEDLNNKPSYIALRKEFNKISPNYDDGRPNDGIRLASLFMYLNRTGYRGLYRENKKGEFNTPYWSDGKTIKFDYNNLRKCSELFNKKDVCFKCQDWLEEVTSISEKNMVIYMDPPYLNTFSGYDGHGWSNKEFEKKPKVIDEDFNSQFDESLYNYLVMSNSSDYENDNFGFVEYIELQGRIDHVKGKGSRREELLLY